MNSRQNIPSIAALHDLERGSAPITREPAYYWNVLRQYLPVVSWFSGNRGRALGWGLPDYQRGSNANAR
ncbi:hypothetical protein OUZ56_025269 [Daphnia magna]|uniref:Uncharacterized protein n=1 Tax=Daphnia magna TaxID=35525 RepID=A0ABQ9ZJC0_9CRUS|nr:hypothetical protein OUZ56_025269 [Daphnia magna]